MGGSANGDKEFRLAPLGSQFKVMHVDYGLVLDKVPRMEYSAESFPPVPAWSLGGTQLWGPPSPPVSPFTRKRLQYGNLWGGGPNLQHNTLDPTSTRNALFVSTDFKRRGQADGGRSRS